jgi:gamma-glutamylputrescine oxidase
VTPAALLSQIDLNRSPWWDDAGPGVARPALTGERAVDVIIIGGGFTGLSTAWHLLRRQPSLGVALIEARRLGNGASGRNGGQVLHWVNGVGTTEPELTRRVYEVTDRGIRQVETLAAEGPDDLGFTKGGALEVFTSESGAADAKAWVDRVASFGIDLRWLDGAEVAARLGFKGAIGATFDPHTGQVNGVRLCRALASRAEALGLQLFEDSPALRIVEGAQVEVHTPSGVLRAPKLVLATNAYSHLLGYLGGAYVPMHSHMVGTASLSPAERAAVGWSQLDAFTDDMDRIAYGARTATGRVVFGGGSNAAYAYQHGGPTAFAGDPSAGYAAVTRRLHECLPGAAPLPITHRWTGTLGVTLSRRPAFGVTGSHQNIFYGIGYSGHGIALGQVGGEIIADLVRGEPEPWADLPFVNAGPGLWIPPDPFRWVGYQVFTTLTGRSPRVKR